MSFSQLLTRPDIFHVTRRPLQFFTRLASSTQHITPQPSKIQIKPKETGHFKYERYWSRDPRLRPQVRGDTLKRVILGRLGHAYEVYPFIFIAAIWLGSVIFIGWWSFRKVEVCVDKRHPPMSWDRLQGNYYKLNTTLIDWDGRTHRRLRIMEKLQDEMLKASRKRSKMSYDKKND